MTNNEGLPSVETFTAAAEKFSDALHEAFEDALPAYLDALGGEEKVNHAVAMAGIVGGVRELTETTMLQIPVEHRMALCLHYVKELCESLFKLDGVEPPDSADESENKNAE